MLALSQPAAAAAPKSVPFGKGVTVAEWGRQAYGINPTRALLRRVKAMGIDTVTLTAVWMMKDETSSTIGPGSQTYRRERLTSAIEYARKLGLKVIVRPYVDLENKSWRGKIRPASTTRWFRDYTKFQVTFAKLARKARAHGFVIGSEMRSMSHATARWRKVAAAVRKEFKGWMSYQANWDEAERIAFWDSLDAISISGYYPVSNEPDFTVADAVAGWRSYQFPGGGDVHDWIAEIGALSQRTGRPVFFGEIGYRPVDLAAREPWEVNAGEPRPEAQPIAVEAAFQAWRGVPWFRGFQWWYMNPSPELLDGYPGADHRPSDETLQVLGRWYGGAAAGP